jgi:hypothetical protein
MNPSRVASLLGALALACCPLTFSPASAADSAAEDWFDVTVADTSPDSPKPPIVATRLTTFDAAASVRQLVSAEDLRGGSHGTRRVVPSQVSSISVRLVDCTKVVVVIEEVALASAGKVEVLGRVGPKGAVQASAGFAFIQEDSGGYHLVGGLNNMPQNHDFEVSHLSGDRYRLEDTDPSTVEHPAPGRRTAPQPDSRCSTRAVLPNTGLGAPRVLGPIGLALVVLGTALVRASRDPESD